MSERAWKLESLRHFAAFTEQLNIDHWRLGAVDAKWNKRSHVTTTWLFHVKQILSICNYFCNLVESVSTCFRFPMRLGSNNSVFFIKKWEKKEEDEEDKEDEEEEEEERPRVNFHFELDAHVQSFVNISVYSLNSASISSRWLYSSVEMPNYFLLPICGTHRKCFKIRFRVIWSKRRQFSCDTLGNRDLNRHCHICCCFHVKSI